MQKAIEKLKLITGKEKIILTRRGNKALKFTLKALRDMGKTKILIQDQGGWITYPQYAKELGLGLVEIKTDCGLIDMVELTKKADKDSIILINSMPGYFAYERMVEVAKIAKKARAVLVNDASGSIGSSEGKVGDIIFGSFGRWKPVDVEYGGFIATDGDYLGDMQSVFDDKFVPKLVEKLEGMDARIMEMKETAAKIKKDLKDFVIIHPEEEGFNVVVKFKSDEEKEKILKYCEQNDYESTICPRYIRVNENAVCIEVKRK